MSELFKKAIQNQIDGKDEIAIALYQKVPQDDERYPDALHNIGVIQYARGNLPEATKQFRLAIGVNKQNPQYWLSYTSALVSQGDLNSAEMALRAAKLIDPNNEKLKEAEIGFSKAVKANVNLDQINNLTNQGNLLAAESILDGLSKIHGDCIFILEISADVRSKAGKLKEAEQDLLKIISKDGTDVNALNNLGVLLNNSGRPEEAKSCYERALKVNPNDVGVLNNYAVCCMDLGDFDAAVKILADLYVKNPNEKQYVSIMQTR